MWTSSSGHPRWIGAGFLLVACLVLPGEALASCQTEWCHYDSARRSREWEIEKRQRVASAPDDAEAVRRLLDELGRKARRERLIAEYESRYRWEPARDLSHLEAEIEAEERWLTERLVRLESHDPLAWCRYAGSLEDRDERIDLLRQRLEEMPDEPQLAVCLAREMVGSGLRDQGLALLRGYLAERPEPVVASELVGLLDKDDSQVLAVLDEMAARRPDDLDAQRKLLAFLTREGRLARYEQRAVGLAEALLAGADSVDDFRQICWGIDHRATALQRRCLERLYAATLAEEEAKDVLSVRRNALDQLIRLAFRAGEWPPLEALLTRVPDEHLPSTWSTIIDFTDGEFCSHFVAAFDRGIESAEEWQARSLIAALRDCGHEERADELVERAALLRGDGSDATSTPGVEWLRERGCPLSFQSLPNWRWFDGPSDEGSGRLRGAFEQWTREEPRNGCAWLGVARLAELAGDADRAMGAWGAILDLHPAHLELVVASAAAALRLDRPVAVRAAVDRLRRDPAAVPRHHAEADYLLGRLARREGRWEEASDLLASYFLRRIQFAGCPRRCDRGLLLHLVEAGHEERLARYLRAREPLVAARLARHDPEARNPRQRILHGQLRWAYELDEEELSGDCASPRAIERMEAQSAAVPEDEGLVRRLDELRARRLCSPEELPDPEPLFPDDELLAFGWRIREVG